MADMGEFAMQVMSSRRAAIWVLLAILAAAVLYLAPDAHAQNSLGLGRPEQAIRPHGMFGSILFAIQQQQQEFYRALTGALKAMRENGAHVWTMAGLSFAYGVFHAAGPGHGKAVISSYMIANEIQARRGVTLAFAAAFLQALTAIAVISVLALLLRGAGLRSANLVGGLEIASYASITALGAWLLWSKLRPRRGHVHSHSHHGEHAPGAECGHAHAPDPTRLGGSMGLRQAGSAILAVGLRPCSGAIVVLSFAFLNGLYWAGILSTLAMAAGTGLTVAALAVLAVGAKDVAIRLNGVGGGASIHRLIEIGGAALVFLLGVTLLSAALYS